MAAPQVGSKRLRKHLNHHRSLDLSVFGEPIIAEKKAHNPRVAKGQIFFDSVPSKESHSVHSLRKIKRKQQGPVHIVDKGSGESILKIPPRDFFGNHAPTRAELQGVIAREKVVKNRQGNATRGAKESIPGRGQAIMVCTGDRHAYDGKGVGPFVPRDGSLDISSFEEKMRKISRLAAQHMPMVRVKADEKSQKMGNFHATAVHQNYWPAIHQDKDMTDTICGVCDGQYLRYFVLPEYNLAVRIYPNEIWSFKPACSHGMSRSVPQGALTEEILPMGWVLFNNKRTSTKAAKET